MSRGTGNVELKDFYRRIGCKKRISWLENYVLLLSKLYRIYEMQISYSSPRLNIYIETYDKKSYNLTFNLYSRSWCLYCLNGRIKELLASGIIGVNFSGGSLKIEATSFLGFFDMKPLYM